jgi:hypothetical protein
MLESFTGVIDGLEKRKAAIERALAALREVDAPETAAQVKPDGAAEAPGSRRKFTAAARKRMALAQKARWAKIKGEIEPPTPPAPEPAKRKRRISPEGIKRIIAATKKRWRLQRAAAKLAQAVKVAPKKAASKKAAPKKATVKKVAAKKSAPAKLVKTEMSGTLADGAPAVSEPISPA